MPGTCFHAPLGLMKVGVGVGVGVVWCGVAWCGVGCHGVVRTCVAHCTPSGLNSGLIDAHNLAWKLRYDRSPLPPTALICLLPLQAGGPAHSRPLGRQLLGECA
eukprot:Tamp_35437.p2 GENE.Tamp_35437~~Tamp_35437.p2  ORF type:complete len:104 (+),score=1.29 Tamp_35437:1-312(+)